jgi:glycosyltransferase involved in cell wall biosynthesis
MTAVHQLLPVLSPGDAIGQMTRRLRRSLQGSGITSEIYAEEIHQALQGEARPVDRLEAEIAPDDVLIYRLSIGARCAGLFARLRCRRVIYYHNITPREYFATVSPRVAYWIDRGRHDLATLAPLVELGIADSSFNAAELESAGCRHTVVLPPPIDFDRLGPRPARPARPPLLLWVSRLAPNKRQEDLIRTLAALRADGQPEATLVLAGGSDDTGAYAVGLKRLAATLEVAPAVGFPGRLSDRAVGDLYARASVVVCASEHEGFGFPLLEAMAFDVPVVAYGATAVTETVGDAGLLLGDKDPLVWAAVVDRVIRDQALRRNLIERGRRRLADFSGSAFEARLGDILGRLGIARSRR